MSVEPSRRACETLLWCVLFFAPAAFGATEWWSRALLEGMILCLAAMCAMRRDFSPSRGGLLRGLSFIVLLGAVQLLDLREATAPASWLPFTLERQRTLYALLLWSAYACLLWATSGVLRWEGAFRRACWAVFAIGLFVAVVGILQGGQGNAAYYGLRPIRHGLPFGPFTNRDHAATWMVASSFIGMGLLADGLRPTRVPLSERAAKQLLVLFALFVQLAAVKETASRGAMNALFASAVLTSFLVSRSLTRAKPRLFLGAGLAVAACAYLALLSYNTNWIGLPEGALDASTAYRLSMYQSGVWMLADFPLFGVGLGGFAGVFRAYQDRIVVGIVEHIHSSWLEVALETGLLIFVAFGAAILKPVFLLGWRLMSAKGNAWAVAAGCFGASLAIILHGFVEFSFQIPADAVLFIVLLGMVERLVAPTGPARVEGRHEDRSALISLH